MLDDLPLGVQVLLVAIPLLQLALGIPLMRRKVGPNRLYGIRTPATLRDETLWYEVNARSGADMVACSALLLLLGVIVVLSSGALRAVCAGLWVVGLIAGAVFMAIRGSRLIRARSSAAVSGGRRASP